MRENLAIITARGGSKRIPRKNIRPFLGKPIIQYSIDAALQSGCFNEVMVSTDDKEIAGLSVELGASVPFLRSAKNSDDHSTTADVIAEVLECYKQQGREFDFACCVYPTAPFVTAAKLKAAFDKLASCSVSAVVPLVRFSFPILRSFRMEGGLVKMNWPEHMNKRSQDLPAAFHDAGQFYFLKVDDFLIDKKIFSERTMGIEVPESEVQDIDNEEDWKLAEMKYRFQSARSE